MKNELGERRHTGLKVVLDTNVYVSIFNFPDSLLSEIWFHALKHHYELFLSPVIVEEFARICRRDFDWDEKRVRLHVRLLNKTGKVVVPQTIPDVIKEDPDDNHIPRLCSCRQREPDCLWRPRSVTAQNVWDDRYHESH